MKTLISLPKITLSTILRATPATPLLENSCRQIKNDTVIYRESELFKTPKIFKPFVKVSALQTTRHGGVSREPYSSLNLGINTGDDPANIMRNRRILCRHMQIDPSSLVTADQVHGTNVFHAVTGGHYSGYDAFVTDRKDIFLCIFTADCFPVLFYDHEHEAAGAAHAGWKGTAKNIASMTIETMRQRFGTSPLRCHAYIGTGISGSSYEVGREVAARFDKKYLKPSNGGRFLLDLAAANLDHLVEAGIPHESIEVSPFCTVRNNRDFFSYRKEGGKTGRMVSLIGTR